MDISNLQNATKRNYGKWENFLESLDFKQVHWIQNAQRSSRRFSTTIILL